MIMNTQKFINQNGSEIKTAPRNTNADFHINPFEIRGFLSFKKYQ
jgi:hypothetical protein